MGEGERNDPISKIMELNVEYCVKIIKTDYLFKVPILVPLSIYAEERILDHMVAQF